MHLARLRTLSENARSTETARPLGATFAKCLEPGRPATACACLQQARAVSKTVATATEACNNVCTLAAARTLCGVRDLVVGRKVERARFQHRLHHSHKLSFVSSFPHGQRPSMPFMILIFESNEVDLVDHVKRGAIRATADDRRAGYNAEVRRCRKQYTPQKTIRDTRGIGGGDGCSQCVRMRSRARGNRWRCSTSRQPCVGHCRKIALANSRRLRPRLRQGQSLSRALLSQLLTTVHSPPLGISARTCLQVSV